jgi:orotidine-5'-phosphate decarboxylase
MEACGMPAKNRIIFPLDLPDYDKAMSYVDMLKGHVGLFKVGLELFISEGPRVLKAIRDAGDVGIFLDLKLHDIPATVKRALLAAFRHQPEFVTVHCDEGHGILKDIAEDNTSNTKILGITVLTSLGERQLKESGYAREFAEDVSALVVLKARTAKAAGCHGVVCSGREVKMVKREVGNGLIAVCPGIRPAWSVVDKDDQRRIITPGLAVKNGADYIVVGRPIRDARDPCDAAKRVAEEIESVLDGY